MILIHAHWMPPAHPAESGRMLLWAENSVLPGELPRVRYTANPQPRPHPFTAPPETVGVRGGTPGQAALLLPTGRRGPLPSPTLPCEWEIDEENRTFLAPWIVPGVLLEPADAIQALLGLAEMFGDGDGGFSKRALAGDDLRFWQAAAGLALEILSAGRYLPGLVTTGEGEAYARWMPSLDGPQDSPRVLRLEQAMPPVSRAGARGAKESAPAPRALLESFLQSAVDSLVRAWGERPVVSPNRDESDPARRWIAALFGREARIKLAPAQTESFASAVRAWLRNLHAAGDRAFRLAFRVDPPPGQSGPWRLEFNLQARDDPSLIVPAAEVWATRGSVLTQLGRRFERPQERLLAGLGYAARIFPPLLKSLKFESPAYLKMEVSDAHRFLREAAPVLQEAGFGVLVPPWWNQAGARLGVRLRMKAKNDTPVASGKLGLDSLVQYQWELALGNTTLTRDEFEALVALKSPLVQVRGQWVQLDSEQIDAAIRFWENRRLSGEIGMMEAVALNQGLADGMDGLPVDDVQVDGWLGDMLDKLNHGSADGAGGALDQLEQPAGMQGVLRPYQRYGYSWLTFFQRWRMGAILADDMGLGKTIQTLALLLREQEALGKLPGPSLLVAPTSVVTNWRREAARFSPTLRVMVHQGPTRLRDDEFVREAAAHDLVLTSYPLVRLDIDTLRRVAWHNVILDEAQNIKNPAARQSQAVRKLPGSFRVALTGTPVENRLSELWSIMNFLNPGYLGSQDWFRTSFSLPIERYRDEDATRRLKKMVSPFILRRVKTDPRVIQDLPDKVETKVYCNLTEEQATLYEAVVKSAMAGVESSEGIARRGQVLSMLTQLKQVCNHPAQYTHQPGDLLEGRSGKLERLEEMLAELVEAGDRALIFTQYAEMGKLLASYLPQSLGIPALFLHGETSPKARDQMVSRFQEDDQAPPVFILSLKAGGFGLNLTRACHVFHFDRWWNPAVENQATDRAFRIGQVRNVQVHKFISVGTVEEMVDDLIESKKGLADAIIGGGESWLTELSTDQLRELVTLRRQE